MKKGLLALAGAAILATCSSSAPAYAEQHHGRHDNGHHYGQYKHQRYTYRYAPRYNNYYGNVFSRYPSYYAGRCYNDYRTVIVMDPYTQRWVCMDRYTYEQLRRNSGLQIYLRF